MVHFAWGSGRLTERCFHLGLTQVLFLVAALWLRPFQIHEHSVLSSFQLGSDFAIGLCLVARVLISAEADGSLSETLWPIENRQRVTMGLLMTVHGLLIAYGCAAVVLNSLTKRLVTVIDSGSYTNSSAFLFYILARAVRGLNPIRLRPLPTGNRQRRDIDVLGEGAYFLDISLLNMRERQMFSATIFEAISACVDMGDAFQAGLLERAVHMAFRRAANARAAFLRASFQEQGVGTFPLSWFCWCFQATLRSPDIPPRPEELTARRPLRLLFCFCLAAKVAMVRGAVRTSVSLRWALSSPGERQETFARLAAWVRALALTAGDICLAIWHSIECCRYHHRQQPRRQSAVASATPPPPPVNSGDSVGDMGDVASSGDGVEAEPSAGATVDVVFDTSDGANVDESSFASRESDTEEAPFDDGSLSTATALPPAMTRSAWRGVKRERLAALATARRKWRAAADAAAAAGDVGVTVEELHDAMQSVITDILDRHPELFQGLHCGNVMEIDSRAVGGNGNRVSVAAQDFEPAMWLENMPVADLEEMMHDRGTLVVAGGGDNSVANQGAATTVDTSTISVGGEVTDADSTGQHGSADIESEAATAPTGLNRGTSVTLVSGEGEREPVTCGSAESISLVKRQLAFIDSCLMASETWPRSAGSHETLFLPPSTTSLEADVPLATAEAEEATTKAEEATDVRPSQIGLSCVSEDAVVSFTRPVASTSAVEAGGVVSFSRVNASYTNAPKHVSTFPSILLPTVDFPSGGTIGEVAAPLSTGVFVPAPADAGAASSVLIESVDECVRL
eukprot:TRINITY_DN26798_c0_g1_i1.p1 TRINITY_DN26798_c0_g1~~TRINITY_DN26798_c0_g1_i1.p1  ORF type:complete len:840 (+),score=137.20 TRINITY_DN26798_c0_g1_i1:131-2521(+)